jgi:hypothetical protein
MGDRNAAKLSSCNMSKGYCRPSSRRFRFRQQHPPARKGESSLAMAVCVATPANKKKCKAMMRAESSSHGRVPTSHRWAVSASIGLKARAHSSPHTRTRPKPERVSPCVRGVGLGGHMVSLASGPLRSVAPPVSHRLRPQHDCANVTPRGVLSVLEHGHDGQKKRSQTIILKQGQKGIAIRAVAPIHS